MLCDLKILKDKYYFNDILSIIHEYMKEIQLGEKLKLIKIFEYSSCT